MSGVGTSPDFGFLIFGDLGDFGFLTLAGFPDGDSITGASLRGRRTVKVEPRSGCDQSRISPPWRDTACLTMESPRPDPPVRRERA